MPLTYQNQFGRHGNNSSKFKIYQAKNIDTNIKDDKLLFTGSSSIYREKIGTAIAEEVISGEAVNIQVCSGNLVEDNGNRFSSHTTIMVS